MAREDVAKSVTVALLEAGVASVVVDRKHRHPRVLWTDRDGKTGMVVVPGTAGDRRSMLNNVKMALRILRQNRGG